MEIASAISMDIVVSSSFSIVVESAPEKKRGLGETKRKVSPASVWRHTTPMKCGQNSGPHNHRIRL
jgi:hypothetical protein